MLLCVSYVQYLYAIIFSNFTQNFKYIKHIKKYIKTLYMCYFFYCCFMKSAQKP